MAEYPYIFPLPVKGGTLETGEVDADVEARIQAWILKVRDSMQSGLGGSLPWNQALPGAFTVSNIAQFDNSGRRSYAFLARHSDGWEVAFIFGGYYALGNDMSELRYIVPGSNVAMFENYQASWTAPDTTGGDTGTATYGFCVYVNRDWASDTFAFGFDDPVNLTYTGGDFSDPGGLPANDSASAAAWLPSAAYNSGTIYNTRGLIFYANVSALTTRGDAIVALWFDDVRKGVGCAMSTPTSPLPSQVGAISDHLNPSGVGDTRKQGTTWMEYGVTSTTPNTPLHGNGYVESYDSTGLRRPDYNIVTRNDITRKNMLDGVQYRNYEVAVQNGANIKGFFDLDFVLEVLPFNDAQSAWQLGALNPLSPTQVYWKHHQAFAMAYPSNFPALPFVRSEDLAYLSY